MQYYPGKYFLRRDQSGSLYTDDTYHNKDMYVLAPCEANSSPEVSDEEQFRPVVLNRPYAYKQRLFKAAAADLSPEMRRTFFFIGVGCHQGGIHRMWDMPGRRSFLLGTIQALARRRLIVYHGGVYSNQHIEMTAFGKDLWRAIFSEMAWSQNLDDLVQEVYNFSRWRYT